MPTKYVTHICKYCNKEFDVTISVHNSGRGNFCSVSHARKGRIYTKEWKQNISKSGTLSLPDKEIVYKYNKLDISMGDLAEEYNCSYTAIRNHLKNNGIIFKINSRMTQKRIDAMRNRNHVISDEAKKRLSLQRRGEKNPAWKGGLYCTTYCYKFNYKFKEHVRYKFNNRCYICGKNDNKRRLSIHHIDYNKNSICNGKEWAFVPLCISCHGKTNHNRWYWFNLLINYWLSNKDINFMEEYI